ncbi:MAG: ATP-binding protein [Vicinamibacterales bacterium]
MTAGQRRQDLGALHTPAELDRLNGILEMLVSLASGHFEKRLFVGDGTQLLDGISGGLNMLAEELIRQRTLEESMRQRAIAAERFALVGQLAAGVAHEVNNPAAFALTNLHGLLEAWHVDGSGRSTFGAQLSHAEVASMLREAAHGIDRVVEVVAGLKTLAHRAPEPLAPVDIAAVVDDACRMTKRVIETRAQLVRDSVPLPRVLGHHVELVQVLTNLLMNAAESIPEGNAGRNQVRIDERLEGDRIVVEVRDSGAGIADEHASRVFEPFFTTKVATLGAGLGLSISRDIITRHQGTLTFQSRVAHGSVFRLSLPVARVADAPAAGAPVSPGSPPPRSRLRLLVIDDEPLLLKSYQRFYGQQYSLTLALGGAMAQTIVEGDQGWDAILCDLTMPDCDGPTFVEWLSTHHPGLAHRVIICSGGAFTANAQIFLERFTGPRLGKPFRRGDLEAALAAVVP